MYHFDDRSHFWGKFAQMAEIFFWFKVNKNKKKFFFGCDSDVNIGRNVQYTYLTLTYTEYFFQGLQ